MFGRVLLVSILALAGELRAGQRGPVLRPVPIEDVRILDDPFWSARRDVWRRVTISDCFDKFERDGAFANFDKVRDGTGGRHGGPQWYDGLVYEMITGAADFLREKPDEQLQRRIDGYVQRIAAAADKDPDGYINTHTQLVEPDHRWGQNGGNDREQHDLYNAGCLVEAGVHYYRATGNVELLRVATRLANHMCDIMGPPPRKNIIPGHALSEGSFIELYHLFQQRPQLKNQLPFAVEEDRYLALAKFWIDNRGHHDGRRDFGAYDQDHKPVIEQQTMEGHAVRATLMATGLTELASATGRDDYRRAAHRLWENMTSRRMYVTGGLGAIANDEKFADDYVLPNGGYLETCAAVGAAFFHQRMNLETGEAQFADELERVLYNGALVGVSLNGNRYFYENPLEAGKNKVRWPWHACPCCPPMFLKLMGAMPGYIYASGGDALYVNLYASSLVKTRVGENVVALRQTTRYPWEGEVRLAVESEEPATFELCVRVPAWCQSGAGGEELYKPIGRPQNGAFVVKINGERIDPRIVNGYARLSRKWQRNDLVEISMEMPPRRIIADPRVAATKGRVALSRGPIVFCIESIDNDGRVRNLFLPEEAELRSQWRPDLLGGIDVIRAQAQSLFAAEKTPRPIEITAIPFYANSNRAAASRRVWIPCTAEGAVAEVADPVIRIDAKQPGRPVSKYLTGACIEDVNHEIYGGIYSQMIFGESFAEPPRSAPLKGFVSPDGQWRLEGGVVFGEGGPGPKLVGSVTPFLNGEAGVEVYFNGDAGGNAGLILRTARAGAGADNFDGYEISVDLARKRVVVGRHQHDFRLLKEGECDVAAGRWIALSVKLSEKKIEVFVDGKSVAEVQDPRPLPAGTIGLRQWQRPARYRNLWVKRAEQREEIRFEPVGNERVAVSGMWRPFSTGGAKMSAALEKDRPFVGVQSQRISYDSGEGEVGIENQGLNRWGMNFVQGKGYEGALWMRAEQPVDVFVSFESRDGASTYAQYKLPVSGDEWKKYPFLMKPKAGDPAGRFVIRLKAPGSVVIGHSFLQPAGWGRFKDLPLRRDVVEGLIDQGITVLRYGGSMVNAPEYRWKKMIGPREKRPPYRGTWYQYSSNGWGIIDFLNLCEAAGFLSIPDFNIDETPQDIADFVEYVNGAADSTWGARRAADGHPQPYQLKQLELGNEERVDGIYFARFKTLAEAIWAKDPQMILVVGDFLYSRPMSDPMKFDGAASRITSLAAHQQILKLAKAHNSEVWFDVHVDTEGPNSSPSVRALSSYVDAIDKLADGAKHHVVVFELNANNHEQRRALANAAALQAIMRDGRIPIALSANCLQPDGHNDNGWNQGLLFLNPSQIWLQPPGYVTQMLSRNYQPRVIDANLEGGDGRLSVTATRSEDGKQLVLAVVNLDAEARRTQIRVDGFAPAKDIAQVTELAGPLDLRNIASDRDRIKPQSNDWRHGMTNGPMIYEFPAHSFTVIRMQ